MLLVLLWEGQEMEMKDEERWYKNVLDWKERNVWRGEVAEVC